MKPKKCLKHGSRKASDPNQLVSLKRRKMVIINVIFVISWDILRKIAQNVGNGLKEKVNL